MILTKGVVKIILSKLEQEYKLNKTEEDLLKDLKVLLLKYEMNSDLLYDVIDDAIVKLLLLSLK